MNTESKWKLYAEVDVSGEGACIKILKVKEEAVEKDLFSTDEIGQYAEGCKGGETNRA